MFIFAPKKLKINNMKKIVFALALTLAVGNIFAQEDAAKDSIPDGWTKGGSVLLTFSQSSFNNEWTGGGTGNLSANVLINYDFNKKKNDWIWDNKLIVDYGVNKDRDEDEFSKNNDRLEFNSNVGKKAKGNWYYTVYFNFKTQLDSGVSFNDFGEERTESKNSHFFSPAYFQAGPGMLWKKSDNFNVNISPLAAKLIVVDSKFTDPDSDERIEEEVDGVKTINAFGVEEGKTTRFELGASVRGYAKFDIMKNVSMENILLLYSNYLEDPQNVDIDYTMNLALQVNKYISASFIFQTIYDDNANRLGFQVREAFGLGVNVGF
tara:strand:- start:233 stop:1195 length:963 start_codon:yes stop_codon:yes gene_type:complete